jgi:hypothetical protein
MIKPYQFKPSWKLPNPGPFWLGEKAFFMGASATSVDAITYSFLANIVVPSLKSPLKDHGMLLSNLWAYCERMKNEYYET